MKVDIVCLLYKADYYIDRLIFGIKKQINIDIGVCNFVITETGDTTAVKNKITASGYNYYSVMPDNFSHSLTREDAIFNYCKSDIVIMLSQDVVLDDENALFELSDAINCRIVYAYGKQICKKKNIEYYIRKCNYGDESIVVSAVDIDKLQLKTFFASDAFAAYHRPTFIKLSGYDHIHMMMSEDMYYAKKVIDAGYKKAYVSSAIVEHSHKFTLKQLYNRYFETGKWFAEHPEFDGYKTTDSGFKLALFVLKEALKDFNVPVLFRWLPDMTARYLGMKKGKKANSNKGIKC